MKKTRTYASINAWQEANGVTNAALCAKVREMGREISEGHLSNIKKGSRRCSLDLAIVFNEITGVPIRTLARWPAISKALLYRPDDQIAALED